MPQCTGGHNSKPHIAVALPLLLTNAKREAAPAPSHRGSWTPQATTTPSRQVMHTNTASAHNLHTSCDTTSLPWPLQQPGGQPSKCLLSKTVKQLLGSGTGLSAPQQPTNSTMRLGRYTMPQHSSHSVTPEGVSGVWDSSPQQSNASPSCLLAAAPCSASVNITPRDTLLQGRQQKHRETHSHKGGGGQRAAAVRSIEFQWWFDFARLRWLVGQTDTQNKQTGTRGVVSGLQQGFKKWCLSGG